MMKLTKWIKTGEQIWWGRGLSSINVLIYFGMANSFWHSYESSFRSDTSGIVRFFMQQTPGQFVWDVHVSPPHFHSSVAFPRWLAADVVMNKQIGGCRFIPWSQKNHHVRTWTSCSPMMPRPSSRCLASLSDWTGTLKGQYHGPLPLLGPFVSLGCLTVERHRCSQVRKLVPVHPSLQISPVHD